MCSLTMECVLLPWNVFSYYRMCSLTHRTTVTRERALVPVYKRAAQRIAHTEAYRIGHCTGYSTACSKAFSIAYSEAPSLMPRSVLAYSGSFFGGSTMPFGAKNCCLVICAYRHLVYRTLVRTWCVCSARYPTACKWV